MSRLVKLASGLRDLGSGINTNITKALNINKVSDSPAKALLEQASAGCVDGLETVFEREVGTIDVNGTLDGRYLSPLCLACAGGHRDASLFLVTRAGADPNNATGVAAAAAATAAAAASSAVPARAISCADPYTTDAARDQGLPPTPLLLAAKTGLEDVVKELLARGARVDARRSGDGWTALHVCAQTGNVAMMRELLRAPLADRGVRTSCLETPLSIACSCGHLDIVNLLLTSDANAATGGSATAMTDVDSSPTAAPLVAVEGEGGSSAAAAASSGGSLRHAEERTWAGRAPIHRASENGHTDVVARLLLHGVSVDPADRDGVTPLMLASVGGHWPTARELLCRGKASVKTKTKEGDTVLHVTAFAGLRVRRVERVLRLLLDAGAEVDAVNLRRSTALHLAAAVGVPELVVMLLEAGANPTLVNAGGLSPGSCFLSPPSARANEHDARNMIWQAMQEKRAHNGYVRRLADCSAKRIAVGAVADKTADFVHRAIEFALKTQRWDFDAREHRTRLRRLNKFRSDILADTPSVADISAAESGPGSGATRRHTLVPPEPDSPARSTAQTPVSPPPLLLDLSPERSNRAARVVKKRTEAAVEAVKGSRLAIQDLVDWKAAVLAERAEATSFLREMDPLLASSVGHVLNAELHADGTKFGGGFGITADVVIARPSSLSEGTEPDIGALPRNGTWPRPPTVVVTSPDKSARGRSSSAFVNALAALDPCVGALREAKTTARAGDRLCMGLGMLREHVKATLIDLMDLETSLPGEEDEEGGAGDTDESSGGEDTPHDPPPPSMSLTSADACALDAKVAGLVERLSGGSGTGVPERWRSASPGAGVVANGSDRHVPSLASVYVEGLGGAALASETEVDTTESLTAIALQMSLTAMAGPFLWALDDAHQRLNTAELELRRMLPEAELLLGGAGSEEDKMREIRGRLVTVRQQVIDEEDLLEELASKLRRRRRQAAADAEIGAIDDERRRVRASLAGLRSVKLAELKALRGSGAYDRFPELLLEHPNRAETAFRSLLLCGIAIRDPDEWEEHHMASFASDNCGGGSSTGGSNRMLAGIGGDKCRLAEIDGSAVAIVEVECRDREAERALVAALTKFSPLGDQRQGSSSSGSSSEVLLLPSAGITRPELATVTGIALADGHAFLEVPVEGAMSAKAWLKSCPAAPSKMPNVGESHPPSTPCEADDDSSWTGTPTVVGLRRGASAAGGDGTHLDIWAVMVQALRGLAVVHSPSPESTHRAVCLPNILVATRNAPATGSTVDSADAASPSVPYPAASREWSLSSSLPQRQEYLFRRAQLSLPNPAAFSKPAAEYVAPEVMRGQPFRQPADVYAFGIALRAACCGGKEETPRYEGAEAGAVLPPGRGPPEGPLRQALVDVLDKMLAEDVSRRCTVLEALNSEYFRIPPYQSATVYPRTWTSFPVRPCSTSSTAPGKQPHWVAAALTAGRKETSQGGKGWWESCYAVDVLTANSLVGAAHGDGGSAKGNLDSVSPELAELAALVHRSLPGARLERAVRLQDRGRWLHFACEQEAAAATTRDDRAGGSPSSRYFADPREVVSRETRAALSAPASPATVAGKTSGRTVAATWPEDAVYGGAKRSPPSPTTFGEGGYVRCTDSARFAAAALAPSQATGDATSRASGSGETNNNVRTVAVIRAVTGTSCDLGTGSSTKDSCETFVAEGVVGGRCAQSKMEDDPFLGVEPSIDDLTCSGSVGILSSGDRSSSGAIRPGALSTESRCLALMRGRGLVAPPVNSLRSLESLRTEHYTSDSFVSGEDGAATVYTVRQEACYPEYLITLSYPPYAA